MIYAKERECSAEKSAGGLKFHQVPPATYRASRLSRLRCDPKAAARRPSAAPGPTQRGCRLKCEFCVVPQKEGKARSFNTIHDIWRGPPYPKHLRLLDNDFFGQRREQWQARIEESRAGGFKVCLNQGINIRMIDDESAAALASIPLYDDSFSTRRLYTAWDNIGDEDRF
jgi:hypothetical protein